MDRRLPVERRDVGRAIGIVAREARSMRWRRWAIAAAVMLALVVVAWGAAVLLAPAFEW